MIDNEDIDNVNKLRVITHNMLECLNNNEFDSRSFKDIFLQILNKKRVKLDLEFK